MVRITLGKEHAGMDLKRARQIINSEETIEVLHNGTPVWIASLNPELEEDFAAG